jgi:hypothetical protein
MKTFRVEEGIASEKIFEVDYKNLADLIVHFIARTDFLLFHLTSRAGQQRHGNPS